mmetsp:Transcript_35529/g.100567  ORF Transcript_35529/g.100567 Transcript_35529/m.100567 type:complete len:219 (+) Transcript_35529:244-900(+)
MRVLPPGALLRAGGLLGSATLQSPGDGAAGPLRRLQPRRPGGVHGMDRVRGVAAPSPARPRCRGRAAGGRQTPEVQNEWFQHPGPHAGTGGLPGVLPQPPGPTLGAPQLPAGPHRRGGLLLCAVPLSLRLLLCQREAPGCRGEHERWILQLLHREGAEPTHWEPGPEGVLRAVPRAHWMGGAGPVHGCLSAAGARAHHQQHDLGLCLPSDLCCRRAVV